MYNRKSMENDVKETLPLYHYTKVETLKAIISNKTLRFNRNDQLNDLIEEKRSPDVKYYTSCFTYSKTESIPMWHIYTQKGYCEEHCSDKCEDEKNQGVRIGINSSDIFRGQIYYLHNKNRIYMELDKLDGVLFGKVTYDDKNVERCPSQGTDFIRLTNIIDMGLHCKATAWSYEEEARFYLVQPANDFDNVNEIYVELSDTFFDDLEITFSPLMTEDQVKRCKQEIMTLLNNADCFKDSALKNRIRR